MSRFNPRARAGRDSHKVLFPHIRERFQSTRPRGARLKQGLRGFILRCFNPRARAGRDKNRCSSSMAMRRFQSTRPRGARRLRVLNRVRRSGCFNPRARAGRDHHRACHPGYYAVSIHAPARGATRRRKQIMANSSVSIHAPARGATRRARHPRPRCRVSIHAPARGATTLKPKNCAC